MHSKKLIIMGLTLVAISLVLFACSKPTETAKPAPVVEATKCPSVTCPEQKPCPTSAPATCPEPLVKDVPNQDAWATSGHNDAKAAAFTHWDTTDNKQVEPACAKCHSGIGNQDFLGADGSAVGSVDNPVPIGATITCATCHNAATAKLTSVTFPSGVEISGLGREARCMVCHQGAASMVQVDKAITDSGVTDPDAKSDKLTFINSHYFAAGAVKYGSQVKGGYQYENQVYDIKFAHVAGYETCVDCHDSHSLQIKVDDCKTCHTNVASAEDTKKIRMPGSAKDYDGDGDTTEGIAGEIEGLQGMLLTAIQSYGKDVVGTTIAYNANAYPYFFIDTNANGTTEDTEAQFANQYNAWTARLLKAAYNYQFSIKDPGAFAHNGKYVIELLYDSIADLNTKLATPVDLSKANRTDAGHFAGSEMAFRDWDATGFVPSPCSKCHSPTGLPGFLLDASLQRDTVSGVIGAAPVGNGLACSTCHNAIPGFTRYEVNKVKFPSGAVLTFGDKNDANLCISCHQGRESTVSLNAAIKASGAGDDDVSDKLSFKNPHYFAAGATLFGTEAKGAYEYAGQTYLGRNKHVDAMSTCVNCHDTHSLEVKVVACGGCHQGVKTVEDLKTIRGPNTTADYDGNGDAKEGLGVEISHMTDTLYTAIQAYAKDKAGTPILYDASAYPYFFADVNGNGQLDKDEKAYASWTPRLLRAAYNLQWINKDPGVFAHNGKYIIQVLYDTLKDLGVDVSKMTRPEVPPAQ